MTEAKSASIDAEHQANQHSQALNERAQKFHNEQIDIDRRLQIITQSDVSDEAMKVFESKMTKLRRLEIAEGYVEILKEVDDVMVQTRDKIKPAPQNALESYARLRSLLQSLQVAQPAAEGAAPHLIDHVERQTNALYAEIKTSFEATFQSTLERMAWPKKELKLLNNIVQDWADQAGLLLDLQLPELKQRFSDESTTSFQPIVLLPLQIMARPLAQRFQYHFYGERPTNRLDKPQYFFSHILDLLEQHSLFMNQLFQPILDTRVRHSEQLETIYPDAISAFITSLLPMVSAKCLSLLPQISSQPQLLSHFINEMMSFDNTLRETWTYTPISGSFIDWKGLTWEMLNIHGYFNTWLEVEKEFALNRYKKIRDAPESGNIEYDGIEPSRSKPTKGAIRVNDLLETITDRYRGLSSFSQKMKFLMEVQLAIFDDYHNHLYGSFQAYLVSSHTAGRLIQGQTEADAGGLKGLEALVKIFGSAEYLERKMSDWSEDLFFLELWEELQDRARRNTRGGSVGRDLTVDQVAAKTSSTIKHNDNDIADDEGGALFDETATTYRRLRERSEAEIIRLLETSIRNAIRPLTKVSIWSSLSSASSDITSLSTSSALDSLLTALSTLLEFLSKVIAPNPLRRITRQFSLTLQREIHDNIMMRNTFSAAGAMQLKRDVKAIEDLIDNGINMPGEAARSLRKLDEALTLLNLPVKASTGRALKIASDVNVEGDDDWGFGGDDNIEENGLNQVDTTDVNNTDYDNDENSWGLWEAEKAIFASNESARRALADMKLELVSESEARELIRRRVEINS